MSTTKEIQAAMRRCNTMQKLSADGMGMAMTKKQRMTGWIGAAVGCVAFALVACSGTENFPMIYTLTANTATPATGVTLNVSPVDINGNGNGSAAFTRLYQSGTTVTIMAPATAGGNLFSSWTGCTSTSSNSCTVAMNGNNTITATYTAPPTVTYTLTVNSTNPSSGVGIGVSPNDINKTTTAGTTSFTRTYVAGANVVLTASQNIINGQFTTAQFSSWTGCTSATGVTCNVTVGANTIVTANYVTTNLPTVSLIVNSTNPASGVGIGVSNADMNGNANGNTSFTRFYTPGSSVTLTAPGYANGDQFANWSGCTGGTGQTCNVTLSAAATTVVANYIPNAATSVVISPNPAAATIGSTQQFTATVTGTGIYSQNVTWTLTGPAGYTGSVGNITSAGLYTTPYPAPPSVTLTATSVTTSSVSASEAVTLSPPATAAGPTLSVNAGTVTRAISPLIYGVNGYALDSTSIATMNPSIIRWGGDNTTRYNYLTNVTNAASDYYFTNVTGSSNIWPTGKFSDLVTQASAVNAQVVGTAPLTGWVSDGDTSATACSFKMASFPNDQSYVGICGNGVETNGSNDYGNATIALNTSISEPPPTPPAAGQPVGSSWVGNWVTSIVSQFGQGNPTAGTGKGVAHWDLDNEPEYWSAVHRDVHPNPMTYDELTNSGIGSALAIKTADPTALVSGPVISNWYNFYYSSLDVNQGYSTGPCNQPWSNPTDRQGHGGVPLVEYYMQQMKAAQTKYGIRLLDYVDLHTYFAANYNGAGTGLTTAGDTSEQAVRMNSTRVFWDSTYTDPNYPVPNYPTDPGYNATNCSLPPLAPQLIPTLQTWVARDYPGTKISIDEYNFGGLESINGAVTQADILGIFGMYGLDKGQLWPSGNYTAQVPGNLAFAIYRNYDGANSGFGNQALSSSSGNQSQLSVYGARRTSDSAVTVVVINKTYGSLTSTLSLPNFTPTTQAQVYLYSSANLKAIVAQPALTVTPPPAGSKTSTLPMTFPAQSITLVVLK